MAATLGGLTLSTGDSVLAARFDWASQQALAYVHDGSDPVGKWYEAALPDREAFCMRDVAHQTGGANPLGLQEHNKNMLYKFALNISESKDWCSYWEINRYDQPAPVDYANDDEFWYNLPANFDVLDACYRQFLWTGDSDYVNDPVFLNFYDKTVNEYVERWQLSLDKILTRDRFMHTVKPLDSTKYFHICRGLPGYDEGDPVNFYMGGDMFGIMYMAFNDYASIQRLKGNLREAEKFGAKANEIYQFFNQKWWNEKEQKYYVKMLVDGTMLTGESRNYLRTNIAQHDNRFIKSLDGLSIGKGNVEGGSYLPKILYDYDRNESGYEAIMDLSRPDKLRREYPEVSYGVIEGIVSGMLGLYADAAKNTIKTMPHLTDKTAWVEIASIPILKSSITIRHQGNNSTTFTNQRGEMVKWSAGFPGEYKQLIVNGDKVKATLGKTISGATYSWVEVSVTAGKLIKVTTI
ncbi:MAG: hypothetical protein ACR2MT_13760 [Aurantibacter sp.]